MRVQPRQKGYGIWKEVIWKIWRWLETAGLVLADNKTKAIPSLELIKIWIENQTIRGKEGVKSWRYDRQLKVHVQYVEKKHQSCRQRTLECYQVSGAADILPEFCLHLESISQSCFILAFVWATELRNKKIESLLRSYRICVLRDYAFFNRFVTEEISPDSTRRTNPKTAWKLWITAKGQHKCSNGRQHEHFNRAFPGRAHLILDDSVYQKGNDNQRYYNIIFNREVIRNDSSAGKAVARCTGVV